MGTGEDEAEEGEDEVTPRFVITSRYDFGRHNRRAKTRLRASLIDASRAVIRDDIWHVRKQKMLSGAPQRRNTLKVRNAKMKRHGHSIPLIDEQHRFVRLDRYLINGSSAAGPVPTHGMRAVIMYEARIGLIAGYLLEKLYKPPFGVSPAMHNRLKTMIGRSFEVF